MAPAIPRPALLMRTSMRPAFITAATQSATEAASVTSSVTWGAPGTAASLPRVLAKTRCPSRARAAAMARPNPELVPVTSTTRDDLFMLQHHVMSRDSLDRARRKRRLTAKVGPLGDGMLDLGEQSRRPGNLEAVRGGQKIIAFYAIEFAVHRHQVLVGPFALGVVGKGQVVCRLSLST